MQYINATLVKGNEDLYNPNMNQQLKNMLDYFNSDFCTLGEREKDVMVQRYVSNKSYREIAAQYSLSTERIRQIEAKAIRILKHPSRLKYIIQGVHLREVEVELDNYEKELMEKAKEINSLIETFSSLKISLSEELQEKLKAQNFIKDNDEKTTIDDLNFNVRSYNCLKRAGYYFITDIVKNLDQLPKIRNIGRKSIKEINQILKDGGFIE